MRIQLRNAQYRCFQPVAATSGATAQPKNCAAVFHHTIAHARKPRCRSAKSKRLRVKKYEYSGESLPLKETEPLCQILA